MAQPEPVDSPAVVREASCGPVHLLGCERAALQRWLVTAGHPRYRTDQILSWVYEKHANSFDVMSNLPKPLRVGLQDKATIYTSDVQRESVSSDGTRKLLLAWPDGASVETVWIPEPPRHTACLSPQVGCPIGCRFCASGLGGMERNLTAGEIVEQALRIQRLILATGDDAGTPRLSNIVIMGMGEPLANYASLVAALRILNAPWGLGIGARKITVSTVGLPKQIRRLAQESLPVNLALSLHAADDRLRGELIPWAGAAPIAEIIDACRDYFQSTGREITLEFVLLDGVNMGESQAKGLARIAKALRANVNLLRYNPVPGLPFSRPTAEATYQFQRRLQELGVNAHVRSSRGKDVGAACGQLRRSEKGA